MSGSLFAQQTTITDHGTSTSSGSSSSDQSSQTSEATSARTSSLHVGEHLRMTKLLNASVQTQHGQALGQIRDVMINPRSGRLELVILSAKGHEQHGEQAQPSQSDEADADRSQDQSSTEGKLVPIPWQLFSQNLNQHQARSGASATGEQTLALNIDHSKFENAPSFDASNWDELKTGDLNQKAFAHFGVDRSGLGSPGESRQEHGTGGENEQHKEHNEHKENSPSSSQDRSTSSSSTQDQDR
jgi:sporulation protein YlmC with PRC-barrel domain